MQSLRLQNKRLTQMKQSCDQQLQKLKEVGMTHETEIDTLLQFNERLLGIIQNQFSPAAKSKISGELQTIAEAYQSNEAGQLKITFNPNREVEGNVMGKYNFDGLDQDQDIQQDDYSPEMSPTIENKRPQSQGPLGKYFRKSAVSVNLTNSINSISNPISPTDLGSIQTRFYQLKQAIKQYKQQFIQNSNEYEQICGLIHQDLIKSQQEIRTLKVQLDEFFKIKQQKFMTITQQIQAFSPVEQLQMVMAKLKVPTATQQLLYQRIIIKYE